MKTINAKTGAALSILALALIAFFLNWDVSLLSIGSKGLDLTEDKVHTISDGTKNILKELDTQVVIRYYATRKTSFLPKEVKLYMKKVDDFLHQYERLAEGQLKISYLDPAPDTDAEDSANLDGISGQRINDENIYFGLSIQCLDQKAVIPFLNPNEETMLEYNLSSKIAEVTQTRKPKIGVMSALSVIAPDVPPMPGQGRPPEDLIILQQLSRSYEIEDLGMTPESINPEEISVLLLIHPAGITPEVEYQIDQYLLAGGTVVAALDGYSYMASQSGGNPNPMMPSSGQIPTGSTLPTLLKNWGVTFESNKVVADSRYRTQLQQGVAVSLLSVTPEAFPDSDDILTKGIRDLFIPFAGGYSFESKDGIETVEIAHSSDQASLVDGERAAKIDQKLLYELKPTGQQYPLLMRLSGVFKTAYPDGNPVEKAQSGADVEEKKEKEVDQLTESKERGTVFLFADSDMFFDQFSYTRQNILGMQMVSPQGSNAALLQNIIDMSAGSKHLIGSRSRAASRRPFTLIQEMEAAFEKSAGEKMNALQAEREKVAERINQLQAQKQNDQSLILSPEQQKEIIELRAQEVNFSKQLRELQKDLKKQKDRLAGNVTLFNAVLIPLLVLILGLVVYSKRRSASRAK